MHRLFSPAALSLGLAVGTVGAGVMLARDATPGADATFADTVGLPELEIAATDDGFEGVPAETAAGRYVVTFTNNATAEAAADFVLLPEGVTVDDLATLGKAMADEDGAELDAAEWIFETYVAGGVGALPGRTTWVIVDLRPGRYAVWNDDQGLPPPAAMTVTGEMPADLAEPEADATLIEVGTAEGYAFALDGKLAPGPQMLRIDNKSDQPHFALLLRSPRPVTVEQIEFLLMLDPASDVTPSPDLPNPEQLVTAARSGVQSAGTTQWLSTDLEPGSYVVLCFVPDPEKEGIPHAAEGMVDVITVE